MEHSKIINVVHLHTLYTDYRTGIDRYLEVLLKGIVQDKYVFIKTHFVYFTNSPEIIFPKVTLVDGSISAIIPLPAQKKMLFRSDFWKRKYASIVTGILEPYLSDKSNLIVHYHNLFLSTVAEALKNKLQAKIITHMHCLPWKFNLLDDEMLFKKLYCYEQNKEYDCFRTEEKSQVNYLVADRIICLSEVVRNYLINIHQVKPEKIQLIYNGLEIHRDCRLIGEKTKGKILYAGKVSKDKGIYELLDVLLLVQQKGYQFKLVIAGTCTPFEWNKISKRYAQLDLDYRGEIDFEELQKLYIDCIMGIIPSYHEQCSYVALEMASYGVAMVISEVDALAELFQDGENALMIPWKFDPDFGLQANQEVFAGHIIRLLEDEKLRTILGNNARELYESKFQARDMVRQTVNVYQQLINQ